MKRLIKVLVLLAVAFSLQSHVFAKEYHPFGEVVSSVSGSSDESYENVDWGNAIEAVVQSSKKSEKGETVLTIKSNASNAAVYINGIFRGRTNLTISNLTPGLYYVQLRKAGYETAIRLVYVRKGVNVSYYIDMEKLYGFVRINNNMSGEIIEEGDFVPSSSIEKHDIGIQTLTFRKFGYYDVQKVVTVLPYLTTDINVVYKPRPFEISNFSLNHDTINPTISNTRGKIKFSYKVTAPGRAAIVIKDEDGAEVFAHVMKDFTKADQSYTFEGKDRHGKNLSDGQYTAYLVSDDAVISKSFTVDSSLAYSFVSLNGSTMAIGEVPCIPTDMDFQFAWNSGVKPLFELNSSETFTGIGVYSALDFAFGNHFEITASVIGWPGSGDPVPFGITGAFKAYTTIPTEGQSSVILGALVRGGGTDNKIAGETGLDEGYGIGGGLFAGLRSPFLYFGLASEVMDDELNKSTDYNGCILWKNSVALQASFVPRIRGNLSVSFGNTFQGKEASWAQLIRVDASMLIKPVTDLLQFEVGATAFRFKTGEFYLSPKASLTLVL
ncbi:MAG: PEGA domain-containing protein [Treponema sp.]|nr:PEGA domain-containing protein [Treponema sp.]